MDDAGLEYSTCVPVSVYKNTSDRKAYISKVLTVNKGEIKALKEGNATVTASFKEETKDISVEVVDIWGPTSPIVGKVFEKDTKQGIRYPSVNAPQYWAGYNNIIDVIFDIGQAITENIHNGLNVSNDDWTVYSIVDFCSMFGEVDSLKVLNKYGCNIENNNSNALPNAVKSENTEIVEYLLEKGISGDSFIEDKCEKCRTTAQIRCG